MQLFGTGHLFSIVIEARRNASFLADNLLSVCRSQVEDWFTSLCSLYQMLFQMCQSADFDG